MTDLGSVEYLLKVPTTDHQRWVTPGMVLRNDQAPDAILGDDLDRRLACPTRGALILPLLVLGVVKLRVPVVPLNPHGGQSGPWALRSPVVSSGRPIATHKEAVVGGRIGILQILGPMEVSA